MEFFLPRTDIIETLTNSIPLVERGVLIKVNQLFGGFSVVNNFNVLFKFSVFVPVFKTCDLILSGYIHTIVL